MRFSIDDVFAPHLRALVIGNQRLEVLAANMANADTPGYLARDIDFRSAMQAETDAGLPMQVTAARHMRQGPTEGGQAEVLYRSVLQPSLDGNTVDAERESAAVAEAAVRSEAALMGSCCYRNIAVP